MAAIHFFSEDTSYKLKNKLQLKRWIKDTISAEGFRLDELNYILCSDAYLLQINQQYLNHDTYTDIITFDYVEDDLVSGDIMISVERVEENAKIFKTTFDQELHRVIIHGIHHLLGQGDKSEAEAAAMRKKEEASLAIWNSMQ